MNRHGEGGPKGRWGRCGRTPGVAALGLAHLATAFAWLVLGWVWTLGVLVVGPDSSGELAFLHFLA